MHTEFEQTGNADQSHHLIQRTTAHRVPGMRAPVVARAGLPQALVNRIGRIHPFDVCTRQHHGGETAVIQIKHIAHHLVFVLLNDAGVYAFFQTGRNLGLGHSAIVSGVDPQQTQHAMGTH